MFGLSLSISDAGWQQDCSLLTPWQKCNLSIGASLLLDSSFRLDAVGNGRTVVFPCVARAVGILEEFLCRSPVVPNGDAG